MVLQCTGNSKPVGCDHRTSSNAYHHKESRMSAEMMPRSSGGIRQSFQDEADCIKSPSHPARGMEAPASIGQSKHSFCDTGRTRPTGEKTHCISKILRPPKKEAFQRSLDAAVAQNPLCRSKNSSHQRNPKTVFREIWPER